MKKIYFFSFLGGAAFTLSGLYLAIFLEFTEFFNSIGKTLPGDPQRAKSIAIYFAVLFFVWLVLSFLLKDVFRLNDKKYRIILFAGLMGISVTGFLFMYGLTHISINIGS